MKAVIFDMDGVLVDSEHVIREASKTVLKRYGVHAKDSDFTDFIGMGDAKFIGGVAGKYGVKYEPIMKDEAYKVYLEIVNEKLKTFPGSLPLIKFLHEKNIVMAVASASDLIKVKANLKALGADESYFKAIITGSDVERKKPFPDIYLKAASAIGIESKDCVVVEDALSGTQAGVAAGMRVVGVTTSFKEPELRQAGATWVFDDIFKVSEIISE